MPSQPSSQLWIPRFTSYAPTSLSNGFSPVPIVPGEKRPGPTNWSAEPDERIWLRQYGGYYTGIRTGFRDVVALDLGADGEARAEELVRLSLRIFDHTPLFHIGRRRVHRHSSHESLVAPLKRS
jgi:hypothetical protein